MAEANGYRATFAEGVARARAAASPFDDKLVAEVLEQFDKIEKELSTTTAPDARRNLVCRAEELERLRAYIYPAHEIMLQAKVCLADMSDWGVPAGVLRAIQDDLLPALAGRDLNAKRAALNKLFDYYDNWESHVNEYEGWAKKTAWVLGSLLLAGLGGAVACILLGWPLFGFMAAGFSGAVVSVLGKLPPMQGWGQWASYTPRMLGRIGTGLAGTLAGGALLVSGVVTIGAPEGKSFGDLISEAGAATPAEVLYVVGLGILFGFTERALVRFDGAVFQREKSYDVEPEGDPKIDGKKT